MYNSREKGTLRDAGRCIFRIVDGVQLFDLSFREVLDDDFQRPQHGHNAWCDGVQVIANAILQHDFVDRAVEFGDSDRLQKLRSDWGV